MEIVRSITVSAKVDTNKMTYQETFSIDDYEGIPDMILAIGKWLRENAEIS